MNKKTYIKPNIKTSEISIEPLLAASLGLSDSLPSDDNENNQFSKKNKNTSLWDETWENPEEEEQ